MESGNYKLYFYLFILIDSSYEKETVCFLQLYVFCFL